MTDITVSRELLRQVAEWSHLSNGPEQLYHLQKALRAALEQSVVKPDNLQCKSVQEPVHKLIYPGGGKALLNRLWHLTCNAVATQSGMRVRTDVMPMREMKEFLDHLCVLVDSPPLPAPVQEPQPVAYLMKHGQWSTNIETDEGMWLLEQFPSEDVQIPVYLAAQPRKAVKLSDSEILAALEVEYVSSAQNRHLFLSDARIIEAAVWARLGVTE